MVLNGTRIVVTPELISKVLHVPRVVRLDYPSHPCLLSISRDKLAKRFCETAMVWGGLQNFTTHYFAKSPRILNMLMTFVLTPRSPYNTITEPRAHFLFSLLEYLSIDFPSHMIVSMIDMYQDNATCDKLIFPLAITHILTHMYVTIPSTPFFPYMGAISKESIWRSDAQLPTKWPHVEPTPAQQEEVDICATEDATFASRPSFSSTSSSSFRVEAFFAAIMDQL